MEWDEQEKSFNRSEFAGRLVTGLNKATRSNALYMR